MDTHVSLQIEDLPFGGDWPVEMLQLTAGPLMHHYSTVDLGGVLIEFIECAAAVQVRDTHNASYLSFGFVTEGDSHSMFLGHPIEAGDAIVWRPFDPFDYEYVTPTHFKGFIVMVPQEVVEQRGWALAPARLMKADVSGYRALKASCDSLYLGRHRPTRALGHLIVEQIEAAFGPQLTEDTDASAVDASAKVLEIASLARAHLMHLGSEELDHIDDLAEQIGVNRRSLYRAFRQWPGIGPARYSRILRLGAVRRDLLEGKPRSSTVMRAALDHGFRHAGRFANEYRSFFGESPSATLRRGGEE